MSYSPIAPYYHKIFPYRPQLAEFLLTTFADMESVADFGCGPALYGQDFIKAGKSWQGYELDEGMLNQSKLPALVQKADLTEIAQWGENWGGAYSVGNVLAYLNKTQLTQFLDDLHGFLPSGGRWVMQVMNWDFVLTMPKYGFPDVPIEPCPGGFLKFRRWYENISEEQLDFHRQLLEHRTPDYHAVDTLYPIRHDELVNMHQAAGFRILGDFADFGQNPWKPDQDTALVLVCERI